MLLEWHRLITNAKEDIAKLVTYETGKPLVEARGEIDYALGFAWWFAGEAERVRGSVGIPSVSNRRTIVIKQPIGVSVALVPWNFPVAMIIRKVAAALAAGCSMIVKPSPETPLSTLALADLALRAGFPPGVLNVITTDNENTPSLSEALCKHPLVRKVTFTGSTAVGRIIAQHCSHGLKKVTMELGGNCPFIVFDDGDLDQAAAALMVLKWRTAGQACTHANRVYVQSGVYEKFAQKMVEATRQIRVGHGADPSTTMGALTTSRAAAKLERHVSDAVSKGAKVLCGGKAPPGLDGYFFEPTIVGDMNSSMLTTTEEIFGPLLGLYKFETEEEVVNAANNTSMGLASYFFTRDVDRTWRMLENLEAGMVGMNTGTNLLIHMANDNRNVDQSSQAMRLELNRPLEESRSRATAKKRAKTSPSRSILFRKRAHLRSERFPNYEAAIQTPGLGSCASQSLKSIERYLFDSFLRSQGRPLTCIVQQQRKARATSVSKHSHHATNQFTG